MKYIIMMFGDQNTMMETRSPEWIREMIGFMQNLRGFVRDRDPPPNMTRTHRREHLGQWGPGRWPRNQKSAP